MQWVLSYLKSQLRREKMFGTKHKPLQGDKLYKASATFSEERIPQLKKAIELLESTPAQPAPPPTPKAKPENKTIINQLNLFK